MKKLLSLMLSLAMIISMIPVTEVSAAEENGYSVISREEYIQNYASAHGITYAEAEIINGEDNARIWNDYCVRNNISPRTVIYNTSEAYGDARLWYVKVEKTTDTTPSITFGAQGKIIQDAHSKTFVPNSFSRDTAYVITLDQLFEVDTVSLDIDNDSYYSLYMGLVSTAKITVNNAAQVGGANYLINLGYQISGNTYYTKRIDSYLQEYL